MTLSKHGMLQKSQMPQTQNRRLGHPAKAVSTDGSFRCRRLSDVGLVLRGRGLDTIAAMPVYRFTKDAIIELPATSYADKGIKERGDLQRLLKANIAVVAPDVLVISEEFGEWEDSKRRIDILGIDRNANLVVIELKRDDDGGHMELQAIRYAAMVSRMTFQRAVKTYQTFLDKSDADGDARLALLKWFRTAEPLRDDTVLDVRIVLVSADFKKELTTAVLWLCEWGLDIRCVKVKPYQDGDEIILEVQKIVPLPEAAEYQVSISEEAFSRREIARESGEHTGYWYMNTGDNGSNVNRSWEDCRKYGFMTAGGNTEYQGFVRSLRVGNKLFAYLSGHGYVGLGEVIAEAVPQKDFIPTGQSRRLIELPLIAKLQGFDNTEKCEWCVAVRWIHTVDREHAVLQNRFRRPTFQPIKQIELVNELFKAFGIEDQQLAQKQV
jgi:hypothetical protein